MGAQRQCPHTAARWATKVGRWLLALVVLADMKTALGAGGTGRGTNNVQTSTCEVRQRKHLGAAVGSRLAAAGGERAGERGARGVLVCCGGARRCASDGARRTMRSCSR